MMVMFLMVFDAVVIAAPLLLQVMMSPFLHMFICLFAPGFVLVTRFFVYRGKFLLNASTKSLAIRYICTSDAVEYICTPVSVSLWVCFIMEKVFWLFIQH